MFNDNQNNAPNDSRIFQRTTYNSNLGNFEQRFQAYNQPSNFDAQGEDLAALKKAAGDKLSNWF